MVIMTAKVPKRRLLLIVLLLIAAAVVLALCLRGAGGETEKPAKTGTQGATNEARIAFLAHCLLSGRHEQFPRLSGLELLRTRRAASSRRTTSWSSRTARKSA